VLPGAQDAYGSDVLVAHARHVQADLVITLMDQWVLARDQVRDLMQNGPPVAHWMPVDTDPLSKMDEEQLRETGGIPIAMSRFGQRKLAEAGIPAHYVPHGIDTRIFAPPQDRDALRKKYGLDGRWVVGINASNKETVRKGFPEQFSAFARFRKRHPEALLSIHAARTAPGALNLDQLAARLGISDAVIYNDQYGYVTGGFSPAHVAEWCGCLDVGSNTAYGGGFELAGVEMQACGTPVVVTDCSAMTELCGAGWKVQGEQFWNGAHQSWWVKPSIDGILKAYEKAYEQAQHKRAKAREFALQYDADLVLERDWKPVLAELESMTKGATSLRPLERDRDAAIARLQDAFAAGTLDAGQFGERAQKALAAADGAALGALTADLPEGAVAA